MLLRRVDGVRQTAMWKVDSVKGEGVMVWVKDGSIVLSEVLRGVLHLQDCRGSSPETSSN